MKKVNLKEYAVLSQSPYTGFNRRIARKLLRVRARINPPIRGSIDRRRLCVKRDNGESNLYQSPYTGFNRKGMEKNTEDFLSINPPIRGSIVIIRYNWKCE